MSLANITLATFNSWYDVFLDTVNATFDYGEQLYTTDLDWGTSTALFSLAGTTCLLIFRKVCKKLRGSKKAEEAGRKMQLLQLIKKANLPGCVDTIKEEINALALNVNEKVSPIGLTYFLFACLSGNAELIKFMIDMGADVTSQTKDGDSALYLATYAVVLSDQPSIDCLRHLIDAGCRVNDQNSRGYTPLHRAACRGNVDVIQFLLMEGADPSLANQLGVYPIDSAICAGHKEAASLLKLQVMNPHLWDVVDPHTPPHIQMGLQSPQRAHLLNHRRPRALLRNVFTP